MVVAVNLQPTIFASYILFTNVQGVRVKENYELKYMIEE